MSSLKPYTPMISSLEISRKYMRVFGKTLPVHFEDSVESVNLEKIVKCLDCMDTGEIIKWYTDSDSHMTYEDGVRPCHCQ